MATKQIQLPNDVWRKVAAYAYAGFALHGRGVVVIDIEKILAGRDSKQYVRADDLKETPWPSLETEEWAKTYNPELEVIAVFLTQGGGTEARKLSGELAPPAGL